MTNNNQSIPEFENDNLLAKIFTSRKWQKKLSNQNMNYQWIPADQSQIQSMLNQVQVNIPNAYVDSCESDYFSYCMEMKIPKEKMDKMYGVIQPFDTIAPQSYIIVQYKNALYMILYRQYIFGDNDQYIYSSKLIDKFIQSIESIDITDNNDPNWNTKDFGFLTINIFRQTKSVSSSAGIIHTTAQAGIQVSADGTDAAPTGAVVTENIGGADYGVKNASVTTTQTVPDTMQIQFSYQKLMNLPYNSCCFLDRTVLKHENLDKSKPLQQINRLIYRQQFDNKITQQYMNQHWYVWYGNNKPQVIYTNDYDNKDVVFSYQIIIPMNKIFWMWQQDFLPLFKLKNPLNLQFVFNNKMIKELFEVMTFPQTQPVDDNRQLNKIHASLQTFIDFNDIVYYNIGCYLLVCSDTVMEKELIQNLNDLQGIVMPQTQIWIESYKTSVNEELQYQTNVGFNCLTNLELGLYAEQNNAYFRGYSSLKDIAAEYKTYDSTNQIVQFYNDQIQDLNWYKKQLSYYMPQITLNAKQTFIGQKFINSIPLFMSINNRGQDTDDQNPFNENLFDYFNKLNIRYEQFTDKYVKDVESDEMNYSGVAIQKQNNNYITCLLTNYNTSNYSTQLNKYTNYVLNKTGKESDEINQVYYVELLYKYKQILQIDQQGNLTQMLQEYML